MHAFIYLNLRSSWQLQVGDTEIVFSTVHQDVSLCWGSEASGRSWENSNQILPLEDAKRFYQLSQSFGFTVQRPPNAIRCDVKWSLDRSIFPCPFPVCSEVSVEDANCTVLRTTACLASIATTFEQSKLWLHKGKGFQNNNEETCSEQVSTAVYLCTQMGMRGAQEQPSPENGKHLQGLTCSVTTLSL